MGVAGTRGQTFSHPFSLAPNEQRIPPPPFLSQACDLLGGQIYFGGLV